MKLNEVRLCKRIINEMKKAINRQKELKQKTERIKKTVDQRLLGTVLKRFSELYEVK